MTLTPTPRHYQGRDIERLRQAYRRACRVVYVLATGGGKTFVFSEIARRSVARGGRVLILVHREELLLQASASLSRLGVDHGLIQSGQPMDPQQLVQVASVQTLVRFSILDQHGWPQTYWPLRVAVIQRLLQLA